MRIEKIDSWFDFGLYCLDQFGHVSIGVLAVAPVLVFGPMAAWLSVVAVLAVREAEQFNSKSMRYYLEQSYLPFWKRWIDRFVDVALPAAVVQLIVWAIMGV